MESFPDYLQTQLDRHSWTRADLARASGIDASLIGRWIRGEVVPGVPAARAIADAVGRPMLEVLVAAGLLTPEEAKQRTTAPPSPAELTDEQLIGEVARRLQEGRGGRGTPKLTAEEVAAHPERYTPVGRRKRTDTSHVRGVEAQ